MPWDDRTDLEKANDRKGCRANEVWYEEPVTGRVTGDKTDGTTNALNKPCGIPSEMADVIIRVLDFCGAHGIDIERAVTEKMKYNKTRPYKHGKTI